MTNATTNKWLQGVTFLGLMILGQSLFAKPLEHVSLQLKWEHQFQFAGYYAAKEKGFYDQAGLDVSIREGKPGIDPIETVIQGDADFGVGTSELVLHSAQGIPVVVLGVIFQHSPLNLMTLAESEIDNIHKLAGKNLMVEPSSAELIAYLRCEGMSENDFTISEHSFNTQDLLFGRVAAMSVYITDEPYELETAGVNYNLFTPRMCGIDFYGDNFFTMKTTLAHSPKVVKAFRNASIEGWKYAMNNVEEMIQIIHERYSTRHSKDHLRYEARMMKELMQPELIEPGYMNAGRWAHIAETYDKLGLLPEKFDVSRMLYEDPSKDHSQRIKLLVGFGGGALALCLLILSTISYFYRQMKANSNRLRTMFEHAPFGMIVLDENYQIQGWNAQAKETFYWDSSEVIGKNLFDLIVPKFLHQKMESTFAQVLDQNKALQTENVNLRKDGEEIVCEWMNAPFKDLQNKSRYIIVMVRDITKRRRLEEELENAAHYDNLTKLPNRSLIIDSLKNVLATARRMNKKVAVLFLDLDDFKKINDTYGHAVGDKVLMMVADRLTLTVRESDYVGRLAGDEFLMVLQDVGSREDASLVANKVAGLIAEPCHIDDLLVHLDSSVGVSLYPDDAEDIDELILKSDKDMYYRKAENKKS